MSVVRYYVVMFFVSSRRRHTRCALVTGVQTCALPISHFLRRGQIDPHAQVVAGLWPCRREIDDVVVTEQTTDGPRDIRIPFLRQQIAKIGRASWRERVCKYV